MYAPIKRKRISFLLTVLCATLLCCVSFVPILPAQGLYEKLKESDLLKRKGDRQNSLQLLNQVIKESEYLQDNELKAEALYDKAEWYDYYMQYDSAIVHGQHALAFVEENNMQTLLPKFLYKMGWLLLRKYDTEAALEYCERAKALAEEQRQTLIQQDCTVCLEDALGIYYLRTLEEHYYYPVLNAYKKAVELYKLTDDTTSYATYLARYIDLYRAQGSLDSVNMLITELEVLLTDYTNYRLEASSYTLRSIYASIIEDHDAVYENLIKAQQKSRQMGLPQRTQHYYIRLHSHYRGLQEYDKAIEMLDSAVAVYRTDHILADGADLYYTVYKDAGNTEKALEYLEKWHESESWRRKTARLDWITEWQVKHETQEKELLLLEEKIQRNRLLALLGVVLLIGLFFLYSYRKQKKIGNELSRQKEIITQQADELQKLDKLKSRFFANVSHELRTPLTLILGPIEASLKRNQLSNQDFTDLLTAQRNGKQLKKLINEILDLTKLEAGKLELQEDKVLWYTFLRNIIANFESLANSKEIDYSFIYEGSEFLQVRLDEQKTETILVNLLSNAFKYTPSGGTISVRAKNQGHYLTVEVADSGRGIPAEDLPHIFNRFYQAKSKSKTAEGGTGIGLAISKEFIELMNGSIRVESEVSKGSTFFIEIPRIEIFSQLTDKEALSIQSLKSDILQRPVKRTGQEHTTEAGTGIKPVILLAEDNFDLQKFIKSLLEPKYRVITAGNGKIAWDWLSKSSEPATPAMDGTSSFEKPNGHVDLILSDIMMPIMDGYQLLEAVKNHEQYSQIPMIMLTARAAKDDKMRALRIGVDDYLTKPFDEDELLARVENLLRNNARKNQFRQESPEELPGIQDASSEPGTLSTSFSKADIEWLESVESITQEKLGNFNFSVEQLAYEMAVSRWQLNRRIKLLTGLTARQYILESRLNLARTLLEEGDTHSVKALTYTVGVRDLQNFSAQFKRRFGKSPSEYLV